MSDVKLKLNIVRDKSEDAGFVTKEALKKVGKTFCNVSWLILGGLLMSFIGFIMGFMRIEK